MVTAAAVGLQIARRLNDASQQAISAAGYLDYINMALDDLTMEGWLQPHNEDSSISIVSGTYDYNVPSGFAYIRDMYIADPDGHFPLSYGIPQIQWRLGLNSSGVAQIHFWPDAWDLNTNGRSLLIIGQKRPSVNVAGSDTMVPQFVSFCRERGLSYAADQLGGGDDEPSRQRSRLAESAWAKSNLMLAKQPMEVRVKPNSRIVPGA